MSAIFKLEEILKEVLRQTPVDAYHFKTEDVYEFVNSDTKKRKTVGAWEFQQEVERIVFGRPDNPYVFMVDWNGNKTTYLKANVEEQLRKYLQLLLSDIL